MHYSAFVIFTYTRGHFFVTLYSPKSPVLFPLLDMILLACFQRATQSAHNLSLLRLPTLHIIGQFKVPCSLSVFLACL